MMSYQGFSNLNSPFRPQMVSSSKYLWPFSNGGKFPRSTASSVQVISKRALCLDFFSKKPTKDKFTQNPIFSLQEKVGLRFPKIFKFAHMISRKRVKSSVSLYFPVMIVLQASSWTIPTTLMAWHLLDLH